MRGVAVVIMAFALQIVSVVWAGEGRVYSDYTGDVDLMQHTVVAKKVSPVKQSHYVVERNKENGFVHQDTLFGVTQKVLEPDRAATVMLRSSTHYYSLYDAGSSLLRDVDGDGFHREFRIRFDADVSYGDSLVYAKLYVRRVGDSGSWKHYYTTSDFWIYGQSGTDDWYVETELNDGFSTADYDVLIDLYESGYAGIVATIGPFEDGSLCDLPLEEAGMDIPVSNQGYRIGAVSTTLLSDNDGDGYYSRFRIELDPDRDFGAGMAYVIVWVRPQGGEWLREFTSNNFQVDEFGSTDVFSFTGEWRSGYRTDRYDVQIDLMDAATNLMVATVSSERAELSRVPLEDAGRDTISGGGSSGGGGDTHSGEYGEQGGSTTGWMVLVFASLLFGQRRNVTNG